MCLHWFVFAAIITMAEMFLYLDSQTGMWFSGRYGGLTLYYELTLNELLLTVNCCGGNKIPCYRPAFLSITPGDSSVFHVFRQD